MDIVTLLIHCDAATRPGAVTPPIAQGTSWAAASGGSPNREQASAVITEREGAARAVLMAAAWTAGADEREDRRAGRAQAGSGAPDRVNATMTPHRS